MKDRKHITPIGNEGLYILETSRWRVRRPVMDKTLCNECGLCLTFCPVASILRENGKFLINLDYCKGFELCAYECPKKAISMVPEGVKCGEA